MLVKLFVPGDAPLVIGIDETIEGRRGRKIAARGIYRDPVRSSKEFFREDAWLALDLDDAPLSHPLGSPRVGLALFDGAGSF